MGPEDWARQCEMAVARGYMSAKLKTRPWQDLHACLQAVLRVIPPQFRLDLDFNGHLVNAANAVPLLKSLEQYEQLAMIETPIPQEDIAGNLQVRSRINRPIAMHVDRPPIMTVLRDDIADGLIIGGGTSQTDATAGRSRGRQQAVLAATGRYRHHHSLGGSCGGRLPRGPVASHHLHEHLPESATAETDRGAGRLLPGSRRARSGYRDR